MCPVLCRHFLKNSCFLDCQHLLCGVTKSWSHHLTLHTSNSMFAFGGTFVQWQRECNCNLKKNIHIERKDCTSIEDAEVTSCTGHCDTKSLWEHCTPFDYKYTHFLYFWLLRWTVLESYCHTQWFDPGVWITLVCNGISQRGSWTFFFYLFDTLEMLEIIMYFFFQWRIKSQ